MPPKKKAANGYKFAEPLPPGTLLEGLGKKVWRLGPSIGKGGFGEIYSAQEESAKGKDYPYVVKVEPHANGPLFVEISFYIKFAKPEAVQNYRKEKKLATFGMPVYYGSGSLLYNGERYRFLVLTKFSTDLSRLYQENGKVFPTDTVFKIASQLLDVLEYIHKCGYVHADIKAANILLGATKETANRQCYLVDFGLACKFTTEKKFKPNPKKAHDGTIEYLSRDAHQGVQTRRGDLEVLAYNIIQWLGGTLPWESNLKDPKAVQASKEEHMKSPQNMLEACFDKKVYPKALFDYLHYLNTLLFNTEPDYEFIKSIFHSGIKKAGGTLGSVLNFSQNKAPTKRGKAIANNIQTTSINDTENEPVNEEFPDTKPTGRKKRGVRERTPIEPKGDNESTASSSFAINHRENKRISQSLQDLTSLEPPAGYTEAMKEMWRKKAKREVNKKTQTFKKPALKEQQPSTSRPKRGPRGKALESRPLTHLDVVNSDYSSSD